MNRATNPRATFPGTKTSGAVAMLRPLLVGVLLTPFCCYWAIDQVVDRIFSLMVPPLAITMLVAALNVPVRKRFPRLALAGPEIMVVYAMLAVACAMSGEWLDTIAPQIYGYAVFQDRNPRMGERVLPYVSDLFFFKDPEPLREFANGGKDFRVFWAALLPLWLPKVAAWTAVFSLLATAMLCISALLREQWVHRERLAFPLVQIPLALADEGGPRSMWRGWHLWGGFLVVFAIDMLNGLSFLYPALPRVNVRFLGDMNLWFSSSPWNQTGWTPIGIFPFLSAIGFFMPTDLLFSLLFFFFVRKAQQVVSYSLGNQQGVFGGGGLVPAPPYFSEQSWGAFLGLFVSAMWLARAHLRQIWEAVVTGDDPAAREQGAFHSRTLVVLLILCLAGLAGVAVLMGLPPLWALFYTGLFLAFSVALTRVRAQLGAPTHEMAFMGPHQLVVDFHGTAGFQAHPELITRTMTGFHMMNRIHRTHPMPSLMEGLYLADRSGMSQRGMFVALLIALVLGSGLGFLTNIFLAYRWGPGAGAANDVAGVVSTIQTSPRPPNPSAMLAVGVGALVVFALDFIRFRVPGFWLHPAGYALTMNFGVDYYWFGLLIVLIVKVFVTKFYGLRGYDRLRQVATGIILGEIAAEFLWALFSMLNDRQMTYSISINGKMGWDR